MLVDTDAGGIDHHDIPLESCGNSRRKPVLDAGFPPANEPIVAGRRRSIALGDLGPGRTCSKTPENAVGHSPVIDPGTPRGLFGSRSSIVARRRAMGIALIPVIKEVLADTKPETFPLRIAVRLPHSPSSEPGSCGSSVTRMLRVTRRPCFATRQLPQGSRVVRYSAVPRVLAGRTRSGGNTSSSDLVSGST